MPAKVLQQWEEAERKSALEALKAGGMENIVQCPFCNAAAELHPDVKVFQCPNAECGKDSCRLCKVRALRVRVRTRAHGSRLVRCLRGRCV